ncbi:MAG: metallophosphoesterase [Nitrospinae bacterium]|nr:metallophosphoesterase [Nitrospinota bacterium]
MCLVLFSLPGQAQAEPATLRVGVVGDTGIGERAFHRGFIAVAEALRNRHPDLLLHLGDFVYQPKMLPQTCPERYIREIRETLADPFPFRLFVPGDNDLPPHVKKPKASGCWEKIDPLDSPFDPDPPSTLSPGQFEGTLTLGNTLFGVLNSYPWQDPTPWLAPRIEKARRNGLWIVLALHEPAITTAWYREKRDSVLKQINALKPDLVFSGNQHSYERFHPIGIPGPDQALPFTRSESGSYSRGDGTIHIISGGGGATLKPFADQQGYKKRIAPKEVFDALAVRALMNHFLILEIGPQTLKATTYRVCPAEDETDPSDPRWKAHKSMWDEIVLECEGKEAGVTEFDRFEIRRVPTGAGKPAQ